MGRLLATRGDILPARAVQAFPLQLARWPALCEHPPGQSAPMHPVPHQPAVGTVGPYLNLGSAIHWNGVYGVPYGAPYGAP
jgi:hypothetical protein